MRVCILVSLVLVAVIAPAARGRMLLFVCTAGALMAAALTPALAAAQLPGAAAPAMLDLTIESNGACETYLVVNGGWGDDASARPLTATVVVQRGDRNVWSRGARLDFDVD